MLTRPKAVQAAQAAQAGQAVRDERGAVSAELAVATPLLLFMLLAIVQFAIWSQATHVAQAAATQGLSAARVHGGTTGAGEEAARQVLTQLADGPLKRSGVDVRRNGAAATVRVTGTTTAVIPFVRLPVHAEAAGPVERFTAP